MQVDHCICPHCTALWQFEVLVETGDVEHCDCCARNFRVGKWYGKYFPTLFGSLFSKPKCPQCDGTNSTRGKQVAFWPPLDLYVRQCQVCDAVWVARK